MPSASIPIPSPVFDLSAKVAAGLGLAAAIAWFEPFDLVFGAATLGIPALRAGLIVALALIGIVAGRQIGLVIEPRDVKRPVLEPIGWAAAVAVGCALSDVILRGVLHGSYLHLMTTVPLASRIGVYMLRAFNENILYRLFLGSVLIWLIGRVWKGADGRPAVGAYWAGFALSQAANIWINVTALAPLTPLGLLHDGLRYFAPGMVWSWLYWRRGFQSNEIASTGVHLFFQPLVTMGLV
jgi:hypothetical protein